jgi:hypothetical protein
VENRSLSIEKTQRKELKPHSSSLYYVCKVSYEGDGGEQGGASHKILVHIFISTIVLRVS